MNSSLPKKTESYTQGPFDETFGQHGAFAVQDADPTVLQYLKDVRKEAENDKVVHYVDRKDVDLSLIDTPTNTLLQKDYQLSKIQSDLLLSFLTLKEYICKNPPPSPKQNLSFNTANEWRDYILNNQPSIDQVLSLAHATSIKLLIYCTSWISSNISKSLSQWIYFLFLRIDNVLDYTEVSIIRDLAKKAIKLKLKDASSENNSSKSLTALSEYTIDFIVAIVSSHYHQRDLAHMQVVTH